MVDLSSLKPYLVGDIDYFIKITNKRINETDFNSWFEVELKDFLDCTRRLSDGRRIFQTNFYSYKVELTVTMIMIIEHGEDNKDFYYQKLLDAHNKNLEFEAVNGMEYDFTKYSKKKDTRRKVKQTSIVELDKPKKETVAEKKLKAHMAKISSLKIKLKPASNGNGTI